MLDVLTLRDAGALLADRFADGTEAETVPLYAALGRVLACDVIAREDVPDFVRSTVDGYAVRAADTFGASESIPALFTCVGEVRMGERAGNAIAAGECAAVPTGGELPQGADAMVMLEHTEDYGAGMIAVEKPSAPGQHVVFAGDDVSAGAMVLCAGTRLLAKDIGALAALGYGSVPVRRRPRVAVISTGDELVRAEESPKRGQVRDVNGPMLVAQCVSAGADAVHMGIVPDDEDALREALLHAAGNAELVLLSGGSSVGLRDAAAKLISSLGTLLFHGLSVKPGKPTMGGEIGKTPVLGLPGHPVAAFFICRLLAVPMLERMLGVRQQRQERAAILSVAIPSNHGREEYLPVRLSGESAIPVMGKSGLISILARTDGYVCIPRDTEGLMRGEEVTVYLWEAV